MWLLWAFRVMLGRFGRRQGIWEARAMAEWVGRRGTDLGAPTGPPGPFQYLSAQVQELIVAESGVEQTLHMALLAATRRPATDAAPPGAAPPRVGDDADRCPVCLEDIPSGPIPALGLPLARWVRAQAPH